MSQTTPVDQQPPQFPPYLTEPPVITEAQWAHRLALTREQTNVVDATELMSDRRAYFYLFHQSNIDCLYATYPLDTFHCWQQSFLIANELHTVTVSLALLVDELTRDNNSALSIRATLLMEHLQIESLEQRLRKNCENGEKEAVKAFLQLGGQKVFVIPTRSHGTHLSRTSPPSLSTTTSTSISPIIARSCSTRARSTIPNTFLYNRLNNPRSQRSRRIAGHIDSYVTNDARPKPVLLIPLGRTPRVPHTGLRKTPISTSNTSPDGRLSRSNEGDTLSTGNKSKKPSPISDYSNSTHSQSSSERRRCPRVRRCYACQEYGHCAIYCRHHTCSTCGLDAPGHRANECNLRRNYPFARDSWGLDDIHNNLDNDARYNVDGELGDFGAV
ncbi:hypothetical protein SERLADRAFT_435074 [Serpula lacrymans var. lacrymans S7.9]|uniref:CCHC-type domain-containing protein n=1 Tax=Serpula lacrymans var. lacrymans (strain S7.9) TaxID=578457 RepID=F8NLZ8_SERL9|nr:uncharacterized protein SERLADRAFT_435074 [Serpula lacrymans var. lacrymans S7.9]EGO27302.1 hypothetical protein SERLADRAFT_435074 [Serpula lacrymans var. lacrymans S7.9]